MTAKSRMTLTQTQRLSLNTGLAASLAVLQADAVGLTRYLEEQAEKNAQLVLTRIEPGPTEWLPRWSQAFATLGTDVQMVACAGPSLIAHVMAPIDGMFADPGERRIAICLAEALEPSGWLGQPLEAVAKEAGCAISAVEDVLRRLQRIDPIGLFARSLKECLRLQADDAGMMDATLSCMIDHLDLVAAGEIARLARMCSVTDADILKRLRMIRSLNPKPGAQFIVGEAPLREPDLVVMKGPRGWDLVLNQSALPEITLSRPAQAGPLRTAARNVQRMVSARNATLQKVGAVILQRQERALDHGLAALVPMTLADVALAAGLHQSTISRVIAGAAVDTPHGTWWLRSLFSADRGAGLSAAALRVALVAQIGKEDPHDPLSDESLARLLTGQGVTIARRTIAKYRAMLNIPPAHRRRRVARKDIG